MGIAATFKESLSSLQPKGKMDTHFSIYTVKEVITVTTARQADLAQTEMKWGPAHL